MDLAIEARSDEAYRRLIARFVDLCHENLLNPHWGETARFGPDNGLRVGMLCQGLSQAQAEQAWQPLVAFIDEQRRHYTVKTPLRVRTIPARMLWNPQFLRKIPNAVLADSRPNAPEGNVFWTNDAEQPGQFIHAYESAWLPASLLKPSRREAVADTMFRASRHWPFALHFNKGLAGAPAAEIAAARDTATHPDVLDAFALVIAGSEQQAAFEGVKGHEPDRAAARKHKAAVAQAMNTLRKLAPNAGSYVSESDFFLKDWQRAFWGSHYPRLREVKKRYDPDGLFCVHHGVGSEDWSADGFTRIA